MNLKKWEIWEFDTLAIQYVKNTKSDSWFDMKLFKTIDFWIIWKIQNWKKWNQVYFISASLNKKSFEFAKNIWYSSLYFEWSTLEGYFKWKQDLISYFEKIELEKFWFFKEKQEYNDDESLEIENIMNVDINDLTWIETQIQTMIMSENLEIMERNKNIFKNIEILDRSYLNNLLTELKSKEADNNFNRIHATKDLFKTECYEEDLTKNWWFKLKELYSGNLFWLYSRDIFIYITYKNKLKTNHSKEDFIQNLEIHFLMPYTDKSKVWRVEKPMEQLLKSFEKKNNYYCLIKEGYFSLRTHKHWERLKHLNELMMCLKNKDLYYLNEFNTTNENKYQKIFENIWIKTISNWDKEFFSYEINNTYNWMYKKYYLLVLKDDKSLNQFRIASLTDSQDTNSYTIKLGLSFNSFEHYINFVKLLNKTIDKNDKGFLFELINQADFQMQDTEKVYIFDKQILKIHKTKLDSKTTSFRILFKSKPRLGFNLFFKAEWLKMILNRISISYNDDGSDIFFLEDNLNIKTMEDFFVFINAFIWK